MSRVEGRGRWVALVLALAFGVVACGGDGGNGTVDFAGFLQAMIANTSEATDPIDTNSLVFQFPTTQAAFDPVIQAN